MYFSHTNLCLLLCYCWKKLVLMQNCAVFYQFGILPVCVIERGKHWQVTVSVCQHFIHCNLSVTEIDTNWDDQVVHKYANLASHLFFVFISLTDTLVYHYVLQYINYHRTVMLSYRGPCIEYRIMRSLWFLLSQKKCRCSFPSLLILMPALVFKSNHQDSGLAKAHLLYNRTVSN